MKAPTPELKPVTLRAVFFDLDGTLVDSATDIAVAVNALMADSGLAPHSLEAIRGMIGAGIETLVARAFSARGVALRQRTMSERQMEMVDFYADNLTRLTTLRPGAPDLVVDGLEELDRLFSRRGHAFDALFDGAFEEGV